MAKMRLLCLAVASLWMSTTANVIGVDLGADYMKVSLVAPRKPMEIVTNLASKRKTEVAVNVNNGERSFGSDAELLLTRKPMSTFTKFSTLLGRGPDHPVVKAYQSIGLPTNVFFNETSGRHNFKVTEKGQEFLYSPEEIVSMVLTHAKDITKVFGYTVKDMVVTVPEFATYLERRALQDAAILSGSNLLSLVDENTAAAIQLSIDNQHEKDYTVLIYNMGANSVQATIVTFGPKMVKGKNVGQLTVKGKGWDSTMGASWMDLALVDTLAQQFNRKWGKGDVRKFERPMGKIRAQARKVKEVLSANKEIPVTLSSLHEDIDFTTSVTRTEFESALVPLLHRVTDPIGMALKMAGMTLEDIDEVELVGGGVRIPKVQEVLKDYFGTRKDDKGEPVLNLGIHLNGDEAMALGAVFRGANISRNFQVRPVGLTDITPFAVDISLQDMEGGAEEEEAADGSAAGVVGAALKGMFGGGTAAAAADKKAKDGAAAAAAAAADGADKAAAFYKKMNLYEHGASLPFKKSVALTHTSDMAINVTYAEDNPWLPEGTLNMLTSYKVSGIAAFAKKMEKEGLGEPKVTLKFVTDASGLTSLVSAEAHVEYEKEVTYEEVVEVEDEVVVAGDAEKKEKKEGEEVEEAKSGDGDGKEEKEEADGEAEGDEEVAADGDDEDESVEEEGSGDGDADGEGDDDGEEKLDGADEEGEGAAEDGDDSEEAGADDDDADGDEGNADAKSTKDSKAKDNKKSKGKGDKDKANSKDSKDKKPKKKKVTVTKTKMVTDKKRQALKIAETFEYMTVRPLREEEARESIAKIEELNKADRARRDKEEAKNSLESYILSVRNQFYDKEDELAEVSTSDMRDDVVRVANELETWLYDDGWDEDAHTYRAKKLELSKLAEKIFTRLEEKTARPEAVKSARTQLQKVREKMEEWAVSRPWITGEEREEMIEMVVTVEKWLDEKTEAQAQLKGHDEPVFMTIDVAPQLKPVKNLLAKLGKKPAPKVEKEEDEDEEEGEGGEGGGSDGSGGDGEGKDGEGEKEKGSAGDAEEGGAAGGEGKKEAKEKKSSSGKGKSSSGSGKGKSSGSGSKKDKDTKKGGSSSSKKSGSSGSKKSKAKKSKKEERGGATDADYDEL